MESVGIPYPQIDPVIFKIGPLAIRWYALAYIAGIVIGWRYIVRLVGSDALWRLTGGGANAKPSASRQAAPSSFFGKALSGLERAFWTPPGKGATRPSGAPLKAEQIDDLVAWITLGIILGGRLGFVLFYEPRLLMEAWVSVASMMGDPQNGLGAILKTLLGWIHIPPAIMIWRGGMSFHGGLIGVAIVAFLFARNHKIAPMQLGDLLAGAAPIGLFFGRIANFINGELYGRPSDAPWAMIFPADPLQTPRHPSQLYEAFLEGLILFVVLRIASHRFNALARPGAMTGLFLMGYGIMRSLVENFRQPDAGLEDLPLGFTMGMFLSMPMILLGGFLLYRAYRDVLPSHARTGAA